MFGTECVRFHESRTFIPELIERVSPNSLQTTTHCKVKVHVCKIYFLGSEFIHFHKEMSSKILLK